MTLIKENIGGFGLGDTSFPDLEPTGSEPTWSDLLDASFRRENNIGSFLSGETVDDGIDPNFNLTEKLRDTPYFESYREAARYVHNDTALKQWIAEKDRDKRDLDIGAQAPFKSFATNMLATVADPLPIATGMVVAGPLGSVAAKAGSTILKAGKASKRLVASLEAAAVTGGVVGISTAAQEVGLQQTQYNRSLEESYKNVAMATILAGAFGGFGKALSRHGYGEKELRKVIEDSLGPNDRAQDVPTSTAGAQQVQKTTLAQEEISSVLGLEKLDKVPFLNRIKTAEQNLRNSPSVEVRRTIGLLNDNRLFTQKNYEGIISPQSVETNINVSKNIHSAKVDQLIEDKFIESRMGREAQMFDRARIGISDTVGKITGKIEDDVLTLDRFKKRVAIAMRNNDVDVNEKVMQTAKEFRRTIDDLKNQLIEVKLLPKGINIKTALSYLTRRYNHAEIMRNRPKLQQIGYDWLVGERSKSRDLLTRDKDFLEMGERLTAEDLAYHKELSSMEDGELRNAINTTIDKIMGAPVEGKIGDLTSLAGPLKERTWLIPDNLITEFLDNDISRVMKSYINTIVPEIEMAKKGLTNQGMKSKIDDISTEYLNLMEKAKTEKERAKLSEAKERDINDLIAMRDRLLGRYALPADPHSRFENAKKVMMAYNYMTSLGGAAIPASISDPFKIMFANGVLRTAKVAVNILMSDSVKSTAKKIAKEANGGGLMFETSVNSRMNAINGITSSDTRTPRFVRAMQAGANKFSVANLLAPWTDAMHFMSTAVVGDMLVDFSQKLVKGTIKNDELAELARLGIDKQMARRIVKEFSNFGENVDEMRIAQYGKWQDKGAAEVYRNALNQQVRQTIVTPGNDKPLFMSRPMGQLIMQFQGYAMAAQNQTLMYGLQKRDANVMMGSLMMIGMGAVTYYAKSYLRGIEPSDDPEVVIMEAIDYSGLTGMLLNANNTIEKASGQRLGIRPALGLGDSSRYFNVDPLGALLGPSAQKVKNLTEVAGDVLTGNVKARTVHNIRMNMLGQNLPYFRQLFNEMENSIDESIGVPYKPKSIGWANE